MKTLKINLYTFEELSPEAQKIAIEQYKSRNAEYIGTDWQEENFNSIKEMLKFFNLKIGNYSIEYYNASCSYVFFQAHDLEIHELKGVRAWKYIQNNFLNKAARYGNPLLEDSEKLTGYANDYNVLEPIKKFLERPYNITFKDLINKAINAGLKAIEQDYEYQNTYEAIEECILINSNDYYLEDGTLYQHSLELA